ncbi:MAG TPA: sulfurtransferase [Candidatus Limnocylindrales bacterium]|nr:sulfurtransferase [Candidatus Limnocylindrales bacterium]
MTTHGPLITVPDLRALIDGGDADLRIVDCRWVLGHPGAGATAYAAGHLPGAVHVDLDTDLADPAGFGAPGRHPLPSPAAFAQLIAGLGIGPTTHVVAYDDVGGWVAARLWWMLDVLGHERVAVLDGGLDAWVAAGGTLTTDAPHEAAAPAEPHLRDRWDRVISLAELKERLGSVVLLDARGAPRYRGETEPIDPVAGHIPTARSLPTDANLLAPSGAFRPPADLAAMFRQLGADGSRGPVVTSCGSGVSALHHALAMRAAGLPDPILYVGSYSDWSRSGEPVVTGPEPGDPPAP